MSAEQRQRARRDIVSRLRDAKRVLCITGAGMSAESGLPTFRGPGGLYEEIATADGIAIEDVLSAAMMQRDPALCWKYILQIERACCGALPNRGHLAIAELERHVEQVWVLTQNVDGLHRAAGSTRVIDIHGDVRRLLCTCARCGWDRETDSYDDLAVPPYCPVCNAVVRPDVVLFGEMLPLAKVSLLREQLQLGFDVVLSIGTTSVFPYIAEPVVLARRRGALTVEINPASTQVSRLVDIKLSCGAGEALAAVVKELAGGEQG